LSAAHAPGGIIIPLAVLIGACDAAPVQIGRRPAYINLDR
jgi:hypothetical protein